MLDIYIFSFLFFLNSKTHIKKHDCMNNIILRILYRIRISTLLTSKILTTVFFG